MLEYSQRAFTVIKFTCSANIRRIVLAASFVPFGHGACQQRDGLRSMLPVAVQQAVVLQCIDTSLVRRLVTNEIITEWRLVTTLL